MRLSTTCILLFVAFNLQAQTGMKAAAELGTDRPQKSVSSYHQVQQVVGSVQQAEIYIQRGQYMAARAELEAAVQKKKKSSIAYRMLGLVYTELGQYERSAHAFEESFELNNKLSRTAYFECAESYFKLGKFKDAYDYFNLYEGMASASYANAGKEEGIEKQYDNLLYRRLVSCQIAERAVTEPNTDLPENLGKQINTPHDEYLPSLRNDSKVMLFTRKQNDVEDIYLAQKKENWSVMERVKGGLNSEHNEGMAKYAFNGSELYFAACSWEESKGGCDIYMAPQEENYSFSPEWLGEQLNSTEWDSQPSLSCDGKTLYFASLREGGFGGSDIWASNLVDGRWSIPYNLGKEVNTKHDEQTPFIAPDGLTLYFSSDGHPGLGNSDVFRTQLVNKEWTRAENLGYPVNTQFDEIGFSLAGNGATALFSSNRTGGVGGLDLYSIPMPETKGPFPAMLIRGRVVDVISKEPLEVEVFCFGNQQKVQTDEDGMFFVCMPAVKTSSFRVEYQGYDQYFEALYFGEWDGIRPLTADIELKPTGTSVETLKPKINAGLNLPNMETADNKSEEPLTDYYYQTKIYFNVAKYKLDKDAQSVLNDFIKRYSRHSGFRVTVTGYTDEIGDSNANIILSKRRAEAVAQHLIAKCGVDPGEIIYESGGEVASLSNDPSFRHKNRRVDVVLERIE